MYEAKLVTTITELKQIAELSAINLKTVVDEREKLDQGFITWQYNLELLEKMHKIAPSVIVTLNEEVVGYALVALHETAAVHPDQKTMLEYWSTLEYKGEPLNSYSYYMMGQICIAKEHRGKGLFDKLYQYHKEIYSSKYEMLLTEISTSNHRSLRAHEKVGFKTIHTYRDHMDEWNVVVWEWN